MNEPEILLNIIRGKAIPRNPDHTVKSSTTIAAKKKKDFINAFWLVCLTNLVKSLQQFLLLLHRLSPIDR